MGKARAIRGSNNTNTTHAAIVLMLWSTRVHHKWYAVHKLDGPRLGDTTLRDGLEMSHF